MVHFFPTGSKALQNSVSDFQWKYFSAFLAAVTRWKKYFLSQKVYEQAE
jgi:hypothetical protein